MNIKAEFEIQKLLTWLLMIISLVFLLWLVGRWLLSAGSISIF